MIGLYFNGLFGEYRFDGQKKGRSTEADGNEITEVLTFKKDGCNMVLKIDGEGYKSEANYIYRENELVEAFAKENRGETLQSEHSLIRIG